VRVGVFARRRAECGSAYAGATEAADATSVEAGKKDERAGREGRRGVWTSGGTRATRAAPVICRARLAGNADEARLFDAGCGSASLATDARNGRAAYRSKTNLV